MNLHMDFTNIVNKYKGLWVTLTSDEKRVISSDKKASGAYNKSIKKGFKNPILFKVPNKIIPFVGSAQINEIPL